MAQLIDTNILVYRADPRDPVKQQIARDLLRAGLADNSLLLPHQAIVEFVAAVSRPRADLAGQPLLGAGYARNRGVEKSIAPYLLFLDADDWLHPDALTDLYMVATSENAISYSDYVGKVNVDYRTAQENYMDRLVYYDEKYHEASIHFNSANYDCDRAVIQPKPDKGGYPYVWCLVTALVSRKWHDEIGGFDEDMESWEDWDYWVRMAKAGRCFSRVQKELVFYRFYSGQGAMLVYMLRPI